MDNWAWGMGHWALGIGQTGHWPNRAQRSGGMGQTGPSEAEGWGMGPRRALARAGPSEAEGWGMGPRRALGGAKRRDWAFNIIEFLR
ncbi:hypothetical protein [Microcoleus sp. B4-D4]|uniref:hypothetical protein n=1 Tax=Microcoleus sp. B4-D4 TaxID=2818667 RepID=UPI002FD3283C